MKFLDEYRDSRIALALAKEIAERTTQPWVLMEICGGQTHTIMRYGLDELLPKQIELPNFPAAKSAAQAFVLRDKRIAVKIKPAIE